MSSLFETIEKAIELAERAFCPTGPGGGRDNTCKPANAGSRGGGGGRKPKKNPVDSMDMHTRGGKWTEERQKLHKKIIDEHFEGKTPVKEPVAYMLGGGPASGKSSIIRSGNVSIPKNVVTIDSDAIKAKLPEYQAMTAKKDLRAAAFAHEESSYLAKQIQKRGSQGGYNTLLDGTGNSSYDKLKAKVQKMKDSGQKVVARYVSVPTETALERNRVRAKKTGRLPPEGMVRRCHASVSKILPKAFKDGLFDDIELYDTSDGVVKVASGKGSSIKIHNEKLYASFTAKANEK
jgi:predicted ABC-type ATPase